MQCVRVVIAFKLVCMYVWKDLYAAALLVQLLTTADVIVSPGIFSKGVVDRSKWWFVSVNFYSELKWNKCISW